MEARSWEGTGRRVAGLRGAGCSDDAEGPGVSRQCRSRQNSGHQQGAEEAETGHPGGTWRNASRKWRSKTGCSWSHMWG